jgi:tetratricopeptide (TPR) repeat protein
MVTYPDIEEPFLSQIEAVLDRGDEAFDAGDYAAARAFALEAWHLIPEPKKKWNYHPQILSKILLSEAARAKDAADVEHWIGKMYEVYDDPNRQIGPLLIEEGRALHTIGHLDRALAVFQRELDLHGKISFTGEDHRFLAFVKEYETAGAEQAVAPEDAQKQIADLSEKGNQAMEEGTPEEAITFWEKALALLSEPHAISPEAKWLHAALGEAWRETENLENALSSFQSAAACDDGKADAFVQLGLGMSLLDLDRPEEATEPLLRAFMLAGEDIFEDEDPKYRLHLSDHVDEA